MDVAFEDPQTNCSLDALGKALLLPSSIDGVYARTAVFEDVVMRLAAFISSQSLALHRIHKRGIVSIDAPSKAAVCGLVSRRSSGRSVSQNSVTSASPEAGG